MDAPSGSHLARSVYDAKMSKRLKGPRTGSGFCVAKSGCEKTVFGVVALRTSFWFWFSPTNTNWTDEIGITLSLVCVYVLLYWLFGARARSQCVKRGGVAVVLVGDG